MSEVIAIDGPAGSGKSTVAKILASRLGYTYLDTGAMYRAVALLVKENDVDLSDKKAIRDLCRTMKIRFYWNKGIQQVFLGERNITDDIRNSYIDMLSSKVSAIKEVRDEMTALQRKMAQGNNIVAEGRDMGTVVFPNAKIKFFLTASFDVRVKRRFLERKKKGEPVSFEQIREELKKRDRQDESREIAPLRPAKDAIIIDTTDMSIEEVVDKMLSYIEKS